MENEIWKDIPGYEGKYLASNMGNVFSVKHAGAIRKSLKNGYQMVELWINGKRRFILVHRAVMSAFVGQSELQVNHRNGIKTDNRLENLEYCTAKENVRHSMNVLGKSRKKKVMQLDEGGNIIEVHESITEAEKKTGVDQRYICFLCKSRKSSKGFRWEYFQ